MGLETGLDVTLVVLTVVGTVFNLIVLLIAQRFVRQREEKAAHIFIASLTVANLLLTALYYPIRALVKYTRLFTESWECLSLYSLVWVCIPSAAFSLTLLNVDKLIYFSSPFRYSRLLGKAIARTDEVVVEWWKTEQGMQWRAVGMAAVAWAVCVVNVGWGLGGGFISFTPAKVKVYAAHLNTTPDSIFYCNGIQIYMVWYGIYAGLFTVLPVLSSLCLSVYLLYLCRQFRLAKNSGEPESVASQFRSTLFIFVTSLWAAVSLVPARSYFLFNSRPHYIFEMMSKHLLYLDPIVSPVLTLFVNPMYLHELTFRLAPLCRFKSNNCPSGSSDWGRRRSGESGVSSLRKSSKTPSTDSESLLPSHHPPAPSVPPIQEHL